MESKKEKETVEQWTIYQAIKRVRETTEPTSTVLVCIKVEGRHRYHSIGAYLTPEGINQTFVESIHDRFPSIARDVVFEVKRILDPLA